VRVARQNSVVSELLLRAAAPVSPGQDVASQHLRFSGVMFGSSERCRSHPNLVRSNSNIKANKEVNPLMCVPGSPAASSVVVSRFTALLHNSGLGEFGPRAGRRPDCQPTRRGGQGRYAAPLDL